MKNKHPASFRDPSGFLFSHEGVLHRQINQVYRHDYDLLVESGLYEALVQAGYLVPHQEASTEAAEPALAYKIIRPETVDFVSYPYEWCFSQLKDAAILTLKIQELSVSRGMSLKDASAYNIQFHNGRPILIDTLSFEKYREGEPWVAYRQFCQHFLAPLALMAYRDIRLSQLIKIHIDGIPLDLASQLLPRRTRLNFNLLSHIHLHAASQKHYADKTIEKTAIQRKMSKTAFLGLIDSLSRTIRKLNWDPKGTEWADYYQETHSYSHTSADDKKQLVEGFISKVNARSAWDLGANVGVYSRLVSQKEIPIVVFDIDPGAVELNYRSCREEGQHLLLPLVQDLTNPSPSIGWQNRERMSLIERGPVDLILALALIHHLAISNNVPLSDIASFLYRLGSWLIIEFVPKTDSQVQRLLATREDIFPEYTKDGFENAFSPYFSKHSESPIKGSDRILYLMEKRAQT